MILKLITVPDPILRQKSTPVKDLNTKNVQFIYDLINTLLHKKNPSGVGLSAVQVGTPIRIFLTLLPPVYDMEKFADDLPSAEIKVFINPVIVDASKKMTYGSDPKNPTLEGCLSIPSLYGPVSRHKSIKIKYHTLASSPDGQIVGSSKSAQRSSDQAIKLEERIDVFSNFYARVIQHEYDHLEGVLFTDHIKKDHQELYFDQGKTLTLIPHPEELILW